MEKADQNYLNAQKHYENAEREEVHIRSQRNRARVFYEEHLLAYGRFEVKVNDTCTAPKCGLSKHFISSPIVNGPYRSYK